MFPGLKRNPPLAYRVPQSRSHPRRIGQARGATYKDRKVLLNIETWSKIDHFKLFWHRYRGVISSNAIPRSRIGYPSCPLTPGGPDWTVERPVGTVGSA